MKMFVRVYSPSRDLALLTNKVEAIQVETVQSIVKLSTSPTWEMTEEQKVQSRAPLQLFVQTQKREVRKNFQVKDATSPNCCHYSPSVDEWSEEMSMDAMKMRGGGGSRVVNEELWIRINDTKSMLSGSKVNDRMLDSTFSFINGR